MIASGNALIISTRGTPNLSLVTDSISVNGKTVVTPFSSNVLVNGVGPVGEIQVNQAVVTNNQPCMFESQNNLLFGAQRIIGSTYYNATGYPLIVIVSLGSTTLSTAVSVASDSNPVPSSVVYSMASPQSSQYPIEIIFMVMPKNYYKITMAGTITYTAWREFQCPLGTITDSGDISGSRAFTTIYKNNSPNTLLVSVQSTGTSSNGSLTVYSDVSSDPVNIVEWVTQCSTSTGAITAFFLVPPYHYYEVTATSGSLAHWHEYSWDICCVKSANLISTASSSAAGQLRTEQISAISGLYMSEGSTYGVIAGPMPVTWQNTDPVKVRWVQMVRKNNSSSGPPTLIMFSGEGIPPYPALGYASTFTSQNSGQSVKGPVLPLKNYTIFDNQGIAGAITYVGWWEYQLG